MQLDWRLKSAAFRILQMLPSGTLYFVQKRFAREGAEVDEISPHWVYHREALQRFGSKRVIEFGAGKTLEQNLFLSTLGIQQVVVDLYPMANLGLINGAIRGLHRMGLLPSAEPVSSFEDLKRLYRIDYQAPVDVSATDFPDDSFDACISSSTLEHIPAKVIPAIFRELKRIIRSGGIVSARTDYSDHYAHTDKKISEVNHLQYGDLRWWWHSPPNHYQNRLRHGHFRKLAEEAGLEIVDDDPRTPLVDWPHPVRQDLLAHDGFDLYNRGSFIWKVP